MSILKTKIEEHLKENDEMLEIQAGFTNGGKIEDNLFLLRYCVEDSFRRKKPLYVTAIDYKKAFDSVRIALLGPNHTRRRLRGDCIATAGALPPSGQPGSICMGRGA